MLASRIEDVRARLARAAQRAQRDPQEITLVGVSKLHPASAVREAFKAGLIDLGENRVQEAEAKAEALRDLRPRLRWHLIGHLQTNKVRKALAFADVVHSLDSMELAGRLDRIAGEMDRSVDVLVQVDLAGEATKSGIPADQAEDLVRHVGGLSRLRLLGLMLMPPYEEDAERARPYFRRLREMRDDFVARGLLTSGVLSMGMSHDLDVAIEEGATMIRVGTAIFGERS